MPRLRISTVAFNRINAVRFRVVPSSSRGPHTPDRARVTFWTTAENGPRLPYFFNIPFHCLFIFFKLLSGLSEYRTALFLTSIIHYVFFVVILIHFQQWKLTSATGVVASYWNFFVGKRAERNKKKIDGSVIFASQSPDTHRRGLRDPSVRSLPKSNAATRSLVGTTIILLNERTVPTVGQTDVSLIEVCRLVRKTRCTRKMSGFFNVRPIWKALAPPTAARQNCLHVE